MIYRNCPNCRTRLKLLVSNFSKPFVCPKCETFFSEKNDEEILIKKTLKFNWNGSVDLFDKSTYGLSEIFFILWLTLGFIWFFYILFGLSRGGEEKSRQSNIDIKGSSGEIELDLVLIPAGKFKMGSPANEKGRGDDETLHEVTLTKPFYMGKYEVTQDQWKAVMGNNPSRRTGEVKLPVTDVSWEDCQEFIKKLNAKTSGGYRLPTDAEWEYACRAGTSTAYSFGDSLTKSDANINGDRIKAAGTYKPNAFGLYDMHGNVWEWCNDWYDSLQDGEVSDPKGPVTGKYRVLRGGSFLFLESKARSSLRFNSLKPSSKDYDLGFRLARTP